MKFLFSYLRKSYGIMAAILAVKFSGSMVELLIPYVLEHLIANVAPTKSLPAVLFWGGVMLLLAIACRMLNVWANRHTVGVARQTAYEIRRDLFCRSISLSGSQMDAFGLPSLTSRMTSDSYNVQNFIRSMLAVGIRAPVLLFGGILVTLTMDPGLAAILCILAPAVLAAVVFVSVKGIPLFEQVQHSLDGVVRIMRENITGIRVVKALSKERFETDRFRAANGDLTRRERKAGFIMSLPGPIMSFFLNMGLTLVVVVGAVRVNNGQIKPGVVLAFLTYFNMILNGAMGLNRIFMMMSKANASANRIAAVVGAPDVLAPIPERDAAQPQGEGYIRFEHVSFRYGDGDTEDAGDKFAGGRRENSLTDIDFSIAKGGSLGIIGATGSGKTTIINLLMRFYDTTQGHVFVDGKDVRTYDRDTLHRLFGTVFQNDVIFADTVAENISFGRDVDEDGIRAAARDACAAEFLESYDDAYEHRAEIRGANFSGGQRQRILIARALAGNARILVLDDSSSALDYRTDAAIRRAIREHHGDTTMIVIAQRVSSIRNLDNILVLDEGRVIGCGSHDSLMESCPAYRDICRVQMGQEV